MDSGPVAVELTGTVTSTLAAGANGSRNVTVRLKDNGGGVDTSDAQTFVIAVSTTTAGSSLTVVDPIPNQLVGVHTPFTLPVVGVFDDSDGDPITLSGAVTASPTPTYTWFVRSGEFCNTETPVLTLTDLTID